MSCHGKDIGQLLVDYEDVCPIGTLPIETSPHPYTGLTVFCKDVGIHWSQ